MFKRSDIMGFIGFAVMATDAALFLTGRGDPLPLDWLLGTAAWFIGFGVFLGWVFWRAATVSVRPVFHRKG